MPHHHLFLEPSLASGISVILLSHRAGPQLLQVQQAQSPAGARGVLLDFLHHGLLLGHARPVRRRHHHRHVGNHGRGRRRRRRRGGRRGPPQQNRALRRFDGHHHEARVEQVRGGYRGPFNAAGTRSAPVPLGGLFPVCRAQPPLRGIGVVPNVRDPHHLGGGGHRGGGHGAAGPGAHGPKLRDPRGVGVVAGEPAVVLGHGDQLDLHRGSDGETGGRGLAPVDLLRRRLERV